MNLDKVISLEITIERENEVVHNRVAESIKDCLILYHFALYGTTYFCSKIFVAQIDSVHIILYFLMNV